MKKLTTLLIVLVLLFLLTPNNVSAANSITNRLKGRLLLQVEQGGVIWYVNPIDLQKYQVTWANALPLFQSFALGITDSDLVKIPADVNSIRPDLDSDNDGYTDISELNNGFSPYIPGAYKGKFSIDKNLANRLKGRLLLQVQQGGAIWYVDHTGVRHNVRWDNLMNLFTRLALGITDADLAKVGVIDTTDWQTYRNSEYGYEIQYPQDWFVYDDSSECENNLNKVKNYNRVRIQSFARPFECGYSGLGGEGVLLNIFVTNEITSLNDWIENIKTVDPTMKVNIIKDVTISGITGKELTLTCDCLIGVDFYRIIEKNNTIYEFSVSTQGVNLDSYLPTINQILSTFKFLD